MLAAKGRGRILLHFIHCLLPTPGCETWSRLLLLNSIDRAEKAPRLTVAFFRVWGCAQAGDVLILDNFICALNPCG
jgi:hypothetical protein